MTLDLFPEAPTSDLTTVDFLPTRMAGLARLEAFTSSAGRQYASKRNYDFGPENRSNVSALSPWIRHRLITEEEVLANVLRGHSLSTAEKYVQEVFWRTYFKGWLEHHPSAWSSYTEGLTKDLDAVDHNAGMRSAYESALAAKTGIDCFDFWVNELIDTGYLHNHARMWFASIWIFTLKLPWRLGADFFYRHLIDGDPASNTLSWRWVAGLHTVGKTYLARPDNIRKYTDERFDPRGLATDAIALEERNRPTRKPLTNAPELDLVPTDCIGVLLFEDDLHVASWPLPAAPVAALGVNTVGKRSPLPVSDLVRSFHHSAISEGMRLVGDMAGPDGLLEQTASRLIDADDDDASDQASEWATTNTLDVVALPQPTVGPSKRMVSKLAQAIESKGIRIAFFRRHYDDAAWPNASKGFFGLKKSIPTILQSIGDS